MAIRKIKEGVYYMGCIDWDRRLFDELIPLPDGTSYNCYLIEGQEKIALIDTVDPAKKEELLGNLQRSKVKKIDYIISNHAEQDHSGAIGDVIKTYPEAKILTNEKCKNMLRDLLLLPEEKFTVVKDRESISLGGKTIEFLFFPWVHWPETMFTYLREDKILFTCDFLGSHFATSSLFAVEKDKVYESAKRYYAEIMMPFRNIIQRNLGKIKNLEIDIIAPSHGPLYDDPAFIIDAYTDWVSDNVKNEVVIPYVSMHGSTEKMVNYLVDELIKRNIKVKPFNLTNTDIGELALSLVDAATVIIGSPTVLARPHPGAVYAAYLVNALRPKVRFLSIVGSYEWGGKTPESIRGILTNLKAEIIEPVLTKGYPKQEDFKRLEELVEKISEKHKELGILNN